jgi:hypothetical protein
MFVVEYNHFTCKYKVVGKTKKLDLFLKNKYNLSYLKDTTTSNTWEYDKNMLILNESNGSFDLLQKNKIETVGYIYNTYHDQLVKSKTWYLAENDIGDVEKKTKKMTYADITRKTAKKKNKNKSKSKKSSSRKSSSKKKITYEDVIKEMIDRNNSSK